ncbi:glucose dehydrogenase [Trichonephila inaurata madagascariensis]|uniref:Glucose dehydrogenase n=1 Tax=Trichonephila inaurata madagascariensis TaxID=2747483 RepID=A0A8X7CFA5_9ARAC|nr:glucose dehydrogenase [Trichonephila inaurata madagascariensis]
MDIATERSYPTPYASSSILTLLLIALGAQKNSPKETSFIKKEYDYIVVGAGAAGSVVASRLSEEPCVSVLLLEAGGKPPLINDIPALARAFWFTKIDWAYKTVPQKHTGSALINKQMIWPSGKGFGGSSILNAMLYVRGNRQNYDNWAAQGAEGWSYEDVFPYFLKLEDNRNPEFLANGFHAFGGPLTVEKPRYESEIKNPIKETARQFGYKVLDANADENTGFNIIQGTLRNGQRCSTAKAYLVPAENRTNLDILGNAHVTKILTEDCRATGVMFDFKNFTYSIKARREVILSAGTTNTAQILMLSGIGPKEHLEEHGIPVVADLPVGKNFHDHAAAILPYTLSKDIPKVQEKLLNPLNIKEYIANRTEIRTKGNSLILSLDSSKDDQMCPNYSLVYQQVFGPYEDCPLMVCLSQPTQPRSRGTVKLKCPNPFDMPLIDPNYFEDRRDIEDMVEGMKACQRILTSKTMRDLGVRPFETVFPGCENFVGSEDCYFTCIARRAVVTLSHMVGTAKMGDPRDPTTVVDPLLRVKNFEGLRVVDASVIPIVTSGNTLIPTIMLAEKASDIIRQTINCPAVKFPKFSDLPEPEDCCH